MKKPAQKVSAGDLLARLQANPDYVAMQERQRKESQIRSERSHQEQTLLLTELREAGCCIHSVWDLVNTSDNYDAVIPILLKHLKLPYSGVIRGGIARALAVPAARSAWDELFSEYIKEPAVGPGHGLGAKDGLAVALSALVTDDTIEQLAAVAQDPMHGSSRVLFVQPLRKSRLPAAKTALAMLDGLG